MRSTHTAAGVVLAGGSGQRLGAPGNKVFLPLAGRPVLAWSLRAFAAAGVGRLVLVIRASDRALVDPIVDDVGVPADVVLGGSSRHGSEYNALLRLAADIEAGTLDVVAIHDGARPLVRPGLVQASLEAARQYGAAVPGVPAADLLDAETGHRPATSGTGRFVRVQTPQAFRAVPLLRAYQRAEADGFTGTDTAACVERYAGLRVHHLAGDPRNLKVTYRHDLAVAEALARQLPPGG